MSSCKTAVDHRWEREIEQKKVKLADLRQKLVELDDQLTRQQAMILVERATLNSALATSRLTAAEREAAEAETRQSEQTLKSLRSRKQALQDEADRLAQRKADDDASMQRQREVLQEIAQVQGQVGVLEKAMRERAEMRAKRFEKGST
jgi:chromosome segregation ATPase